MLLKGKKALITGGSAGIGEAIALRFVQEGAHVAILGTNSERLASVHTKMEELKVDSEQKFLALLGNVSSKQSVEATIEQVMSSFNGVDILVNNAGITRDGLLMKMKEEDWDDVLDTNLKSVYNLTSALIRTMMKARSGKIINISSVVGLTGNPGQTNYAASKAGMIGFTKALALEVASRGIQVNAIAPGYIKTRMTDALTSEQQALVLNKVPLGRMGNPEDIASCACFLASHMSDYMTGQTLVVDGGMVM
jgi:3-oxoacyl-[acyl-carrier protein] reductase